MVRALLGTELAPSWHGSCYATMSPQGVTYGTIYCIAKPGGVYALVRLENPCQTLESLRQGAWA
jgi:hypothetical protein